MRSESERKGCTLGKFQKRAGKRVYGGKRAGTKEKGGAKKQNTDPSFLSDIGELDREIVVI